MIGKEAFSDFGNYDKDFLATPIEKKAIYERVIYSVSQKIKDEQRCIKQTERQI